MYSDDDFWLEDYVEPDPHDPDDHTGVRVYPPFEAFFGRAWLARYDLVAQMAKAFNLKPRSELIPDVEEFLVEIERTAAEGYAEGWLHLGPRRRVEGVPRLLNEVLAVGSPTKLQAILEAIRKDNVEFTTTSASLDESLRRVLTKHFKPRLTIVLAKALRWTRRMERAA